MITFLLPIGLVAFVSILALIIIYIIRANYQQKEISSSYVWALSLKMKKRRLPVSKLRNLLLILCQILFLTACVLAIAQPSQITRMAVAEREVIAVIDASVSMRAGESGWSRFDRAVEKASELAESVFNAGGYVSIFVADATPVILAQRATADVKDSVLQSLDALITEDSCSYGSSNIEDAMGLCQNVIRENANAEVYLYTDTEYAYVPEKVNVVDVTEEGEWNAGILNAYTVMEDNYYSVYVQVASYGAAQSVSVTMQVNNANAEEVEGGKTVTLNAAVSCRDSEPVTVIFRSGSLGDNSSTEDAENVVIVSMRDNERFFSYKSITVTLDCADSFSEDNSFSIYEGDKEVVKVLYSSPSPNNFIPGLFGAFQANYNKNVWDMQITEVHSDPPTEGYDIYIYEHLMPDQMPTDGIVILWDLDKAPNGSGLTLGGIKDYSSTGSGLNLSQKMDSPLLEKVNAGNITVSRFTDIFISDSSYKELLTCDTRPVLLAKDEEDAKVLVLPFSIHYSSIALDIVDFSRLFYNVLNNWMPVIVPGHTFDVYEKVTVNGRGESATVTSTATQDSEIVLNEFPASVTLDLPGTYTIRQTTGFGKEIVTQIYVKIPSEESNIWSKEDTCGNPYLVDSIGTTYKDLTLYFAIAIVVMLFCEWILHSRENF